MVVLYQSTKSSIQAIQEDSAQRYVDTVRDRLSAYFDKWKVTVDPLSKMPEVKSKDWGKLKSILNAISTKYDEVRAFAMSNADGSYWYEPIPGNPAQNWIVTEDDTNPEAKPKYLSHLTWHKSAVVDNPQNLDKQVITEVYISVGEKMKMMAISSAIRDDQGKVIGALCTSMAADALNYQAYCHYYGNSQYNLCHYGLILYQWTVYQAHSAGKRNVEPACIRNRRFGYPYG